MSIVVVFYLDHHDSSDIANLTLQEIRMIPSSKSRRGMFGPEWVLFIALIGFVIAVAINGQAP